MLAIELVLRVVMDLDAVGAKAEMAEAPKRTVATAAA